jgi:hypothetical protein
MLHHFELVSRRFERYTSEQAGGIDNRMLMQFVNCACGTAIPDSIRVTYRKLTDSGWVQKRPRVFVNREGAPRFIQYSKRQYSDISQLDNELQRSRDDSSDIFMMRQGGWTYPNVGFKVHQVALQSATKVGRNARISVIGTVTGDWNRTLLHLIEKHERIKGS